MTTHVLMVVDMSGSMYALAEDVRGGFNSFLSEQEKDADELSFTVTLFDQEFISLCVAETWAATPRLDRDNYNPRGMTALLDAVGKTIVEFESSAGLGAEDKVLVVVQTDGNENASSEFSKERIAEMIAEREKTGKWSFVFLGAGPNTWRQAGQMGFQRANTVSYATGQTVNSYTGISRGREKFSKGAPAEFFVAEVADATGGETHGENEEK